MEACLARYLMPERPFRHQPHTRAQGRSGEDDAVEYLRGLGYQILERNVSNKAGEIDVVATEDSTLCFIEVKARSSRTYGPAIEAVSLHKQRRVARAAALYLAFHRTDSPCRFDVLAMDLVGGGWQFTLVRDAFQVPDGSYGR